MKNSNQNTESPALVKPLLGAGLPDSEYIKELEGLVCFLARCYEKTKQVYFEKHLETCSVANPERRDLTDVEKSELHRFPLVQGTKLQQIVTDISNANKPDPVDLHGALQRLLPCA